MGITPDQLHAMDAHVDRGALLDVLKHLATYRDWCHDSQGCPLCGHPSAHMLDCPSPLLEAVRR